MTVTAKKLYNDKWHNKNHLVILHNQSTAIVNVYRSSI